MPLVNVLRIRGTDVQILINEKAGVIKALHFGHNQKSNAILRFVFKNDSPSFVIMFQKN